MYLRRALGNNNTIDTKFNKYIIYKDTHWMEISFNQIVVHCLYQVILKNANTHFIALKASHS